MYAHFAALVNKRAVCIILDAEAGVPPLFEKKTMAPEKKGIKNIHMVAFGGVNRKT